MASVYSLIKRYLQREIISLVLILFVLSSHSQVVINEYSVSNLASFQDNYQKYEDWFELRNTGATVVNLEGYYLSDNPDKPTKYVIPGGVSIQPGAYLRVWASGRDEFSGNHLHTNFKLSQTKDDQEFIVLTSSDEVILDQVSLYKTMKGHSRGKSLFGNDQWVVYANPTPGAVNGGTTYSDYAPKPLMSQAAGFYPNAITVELSTEDPELQIRYTLDGSEPTPTSPLYLNPIPISQNTIINARCYSSNSSIHPGWLVFNSYFINTTHSMAVISASAAQLDDLLNGNQSFTPFGTFEYFNKNGVRTTFGYGEYNEHGQDSWVHDQRSIDYITRDECGYNYAIRDTLIPITDRNEFQRIILRAAGDDNYPGIDSSALLRDMFVQNTAQRNGMHLDVRKGEKCVLYVNGQFWGVYGIREKVSDHDFTEYYYGQDKYHLYFLQLWGGSWAEYGGQAAWDDWNELHDFIKFNDMSNQDNFEYVKTRLDYKSLADYIIINSFVVCSDWINWNVGWWRGTNPEGGHQKWGYILWDEDATFNHYINYTGVPGTQPTVSPCFPHNLTSDPEQHIYMLNRLRNNAEFNQYYISRYVDLYNTAFKPESMISYLDEIAGKMQPEMQRHVQRWGGTVTRWQSNVQKIRNFINARYDYLPQGLKSCNNLTGPYNYQVSVDPPEAGTIELNSLNLETFPWQGTYFGGLNVQLKAVPATSNIEFDYWEIPGHAINPAINAAEVYFNPVQNAGIIAHFRNKVYADSLVINEINYNPNDNFDPGDWVEVYNPHPYQLDVSGWVFKDEDDTHAFEFPQGTVMTAHGYLVICTDGEAFSNLFPDVDNYIGDTGFGLSGSGELIRIYNDEGTLIDQVTYDDNDPWPNEPDGDGPTLELRHPALDNALPESWMSSPEHGTPGQQNSQWVGFDDFTSSTGLKLSVVPNPVRNAATVTIEGMQSVKAGHLYLSTIFGTVVWSTSVMNTNSIMIPFEALPSGVYIVHFVDANGKSAQKRIVH
ncbi:MAG: Spore coat protein CotH [Bacteroidetes bacterium]|nr:MAG: Spore coat protein CotH [Bacteroidota bacterium]